MTAVVPVPKVRHGLILRGWSVEEAAEKAGLSRPTVTRMVLGRPVTLRSILAMSIAFEQTKPGLNELLEICA